MKKVVAVVRLERLNDIRESLEKEGFTGMTITPASGVGAEKGITLHWRGYRLEGSERLLPRVKVEIVATDMDIPKIADTICRAAKTGRVGDGRIFVERVEQVIRIRDGNRGEDVIAPGRLVEVSRVRAEEEAEKFEYELA